MPQIPTIQTKLSNVTAVPETQVSPNAFGYQQGQALEGLGQELGKAANDLDVYAREENQRKKSEDTANIVAQAQPDLARIALEEQQNAPPDGSGTSANILKKQNEYISAKTADIKDDDVRTKARTELTSRSSQYGVSGVEFEFKQNAEYSRTQANTSLVSAENVVRADPKQYEAGIKDSFAVIDARPGLNAALKESMKTDARQRLAYVRFDGLLASAQSVEEFDAITKQLTDGSDGKDWKKEFAGSKPETGDSVYGKMLNDVNTAKKTFQTALGTKVRTYVDGLEARSKDLSLIPPEDINDAVSMAQNTGDGNLMRRAARLQRDQDLLKNDGKLPNAELQARINDGKGGPSGVMKNLPPELNNSINEASKIFPDVSAAYLGGTAMREYGGNLAGGGRRGDARYTPQPLRPDVDVRNLDAATADAATLAGQIWGGPLPLTSGYRSQAKQDALRAGNPAGAAAGRIAKTGHHQEGNAIDVSTLGMDMGQQTKLVDSLAQAGFTGFGWYKGHLHADMRQSVPGSFGGKWGGWTDLPEPIMQTLTKRGFQAGANANSVDRSGSNIAFTPIDYGKGTSIVGADGKPTSSATGVFQFTNGTWLDLAKDGATAQRIGMDINGKSDEEILALRKDPKWSTLMGAALADKNKKDMEGTLGRTVNDAELYMAHFLGSPGAVALINAAQNNPDATGAQILPKAAAANGPMFRRNGRDLTAKQVYNNIVQKFSTEPSQVAYQDTEYRQKILDTRRKQVGDDMITYVRQSGVFPVQDLSADGGFTMRASTTATAADYFNIPIPDSKPFDKDEQASLSKSLKEGTPAETLGVMANIQAMDAVKPGLAKAAYKQLGEEDGVYAYAAGLMYDRDASNTATDIVRGQRRLSQNPEMKSGFGEGNQASKDFDTETGVSLYGLKGETRSSIFKAAQALYAERYIATGTTTYDSSLFKKSINDVLGGQDAVAEINGAKVPVPPGMDAETFEKAFERLSDQDLAVLSVSGEPPRHVTGDVITAQEIKYEGKLRWVGGTQYQIEMADHTWATTMQPDPASRNAFKYYRINADAKQLQNIVTRPDVETAAVTNTKSNYGSPYKYGWRNVDEPKPQDVAMNNAGGPQ